MFNKGRNHAPHWISGTAIVTLACFSSTLVAATCDVQSLQAAAPADTTVISAIMREQPVRHCKIEGYSVTSNPGPNKVSFGLQLPDKANWNNRFYFIGVGGSGGGAVPSDASFAPRVAAGWATAGTDKGHPGISDWSFNSDPVKALDNSHRGAHVSTVAAQALTKAYYGVNKMHRYHTGCSGGGDMGFKPMQYYPKDYDGILLGWVGGPHPNPDMDGSARAFAVMVREMTREPGSWLSPAKLQFADRKVLEACDTADGAKDELIQDSRQCKFDFSELKCSGADGPECLTQPEITSLTNLVRDTPGPISNISSWSNLGTKPPPWTPVEPGSRGPTGAATAYTNLNGWARTNLNQPDRDIIKTPLSREELERVIDIQARTGGMDMANRWNLEGFEAAKGKAIFYVGVGDPAFSHVGMENWFNIWTQKIGPARRDKIGKLYQVPGWGHCGGGTGPTDGTDVMLEALINWVEKGVSPQALTMHRGADRVRSLFPGIQSAAGQAEAGARVRVSSAPSRDFLVCPYPQIAAFDQSKANVPGAVYEAKNWTCKPSPYVVTTR